MRRRSRISRVFVVSMTENKSGQGSAARNAVAGQLTAGDRFHVLISERIAFLNDIVFNGIQQPHRLFIFFLNLWEVLFQQFLGCRVPHLVWG